MSTMGLTQSATVYAEDAATGAYTTVLKSGLKCRLVHVGRQTATTAGERAELAAIRNLLFEPDYVMPETAQIEVDSIRWAPVAGTFGAFRGPSGAVVFRRADVVRQG